MDNDKKTGILVISRHTESEWNLLGKWTGLTDVNLTEKGHSDSTALGAALQDIDFNYAFTSDLKRTQETLQGILKGKGAAVELPHICAPELNERDYGELTGMNKWEVKEKLGEEEFNNIRRSWDHPVPGGETLKVVCERAGPYFTNEILPKLQAGNNVLLVSHGNTIRALMKEFENIPEADMATVEMPFGTLLVYYFEPNSNLPYKKEVRAVDIAPTNA